MKGISAKVYETLNIQERIRATIIAEGRGDEAEVRRLVSSCPKQAYQITDPAYSDAMQSLSAVSVAVEAELRSLALRYFIYLYKKHPDTEAYLQDMADIKAGWLAVLEELGVSTKVVGSFGAPVDPVVRSLFGRAPEPDNQSAQMYKERLSSLLSYGG